MSDDCKHTAMMWGQISRQDDDGAHLRHADHCIFCGDTQREIDLEKRVKELEEENKEDFGLMMRYQMFIRDNGHTEAYTKYATEMGYKDET